MKFSTTGQEKGDLLMQVTAWAGLTVSDFFYDMKHPMYTDWSWKSFNLRLQIKNVDI